MTRYELFGDLNGADMLRFGNLLVPMVTEIRKLHNNS